MEKDDGTITYFTSLHEYVEKAIAKGIIRKPLPMKGQQPVQQTTYEDKSALEGASRGSTLPPSTYVTQQPQQPKKETSAYISMPPRPPIPQPKESAYGSMPPPDERSYATNAAPGSSRPSTLPKSPSTQALRPTTISDYGAMPLATSTSPPPSTSSLRPMTMQDYGGMPPLRPTGMADYGGMPMIEEAIASMHVTHPTHPTQPQPARGQQSLYSSMPEPPKTGAAPAKANGSVVRSVEASSAPIKIAPAGPNRSLYSTVIEEKKDDEEPLLSNHRKPKQTASKP